jgi:dihydrofolate reductase
MRISQIVAASLNNVIGKDNGLPWHMPVDAAYFREKTWGHHVVMGRRNYEAEGKPLPGRVNIVLTRKSGLSLRGALVMQQIEDAIAFAESRKENELFIIGGAKIYQLAMPFTDRIYLTRIHAVIDGDTFYPEPEWKNWQETSRLGHKKDTSNPYDYDFLVYDRIRT